VPSLVQADNDRLAEFTERYEPPDVEDIDPGFIHLSPAVMERSDFDALERYAEPVEPRVIDSFDYAHQATVTAESAESFIRAVRGRLDSHDTTFDKVFDVMRSKRFRAGTVKQTRFDENRELFRPIVEGHIEAGSPLEFVMPSFPFKHNNPVKATRRSPDIAEVLCLSRLYEICDAIGLVYEPGAKFVIISDGQVYHRMFGVTHHEALTFRERAKEMITELGWDDTLEIVDMQDLVDSRKALFDYVEERLRPVLEEWWGTNTDNLRRKSLIAAAATNLNTADGVTDDLVQLATKDAVLGVEEEEDLANLAKIKSAAVDRAEEGAFEFALFLYVLREIDLVQSCYPGAIRATVHPKPGQWGLHLVNKESQVFPWQGVAYRNEDGQWRIKYEFEMRRTRATPVHVRGDDEMFPFYYEHSGQPDEHSEEAAAE